MSAKTQHTVESFSGAMASRARSVFHQIHQTPAICAQMLVCIRIALRHFQGRWHI